MMKKFIAPLLALLVSGCQIDPYTHAPTLTSTDWYDVGMEDAISGSAIKMTMHLAIHRRIAVYTLKDMPKDKENLPDRFYLCPRTFW